MSDTNLDQNIKPKKCKNVCLWIVQILLAALFIFAGIMKLTSPIDVLVKQIPGFSGGFIRFIGLAEVLGGAGLVLPWLFKIWKILTPIAAIGLLIIMIGAVVVTIMSIGYTSVIMPLIVGVLCYFIIRGRWN